jgi:DNA-binding NtrC family response regulator
MLSRNAKSDPKEMMLSNPQANRVLVVIDDPNMARALADMLEALESDVAADTAHGFHGAFTKMQQAHYTTLVVDYEMPGFNGMDLAQAVRHISPDTRVVLMASSESQALRETAQILGVSDVLVKPVRLAELRRLVARENGKPDWARRILLLERRNDVRHRYGDALRDAQHYVHEAAALDEVRDLLAIRRFDVFICALDANGENAAEFISQRRPMLRAAGTRVIGITSSGGFDSHWEEMGVDLYLQTPVATDSLVTLVDRITSTNGSAGHSSLDLRVEGAVLAAIPA